MGCPRVNVLHFYLLLYTNVTGEVITTAYIIKGHHGSIRMTPNSSLKIKG